MTLTQLRHLIALAHCGSFGKAAEAVHLTQPALSRSIHALETELGFALLDRIGHKQLLTPFGRDVLESAIALVGEADALLDHGERLREGMGGRLRVGMGSGPGALLAAPFLLHVATERPHLRVHVQRGGTAVLVRALRENELDALVIDARALKPESDLTITDVYEMRAAYLCRPDHPLTRQRNGVRFKQLMQYPLAAAPLSEEVARGLVETYGPEANPSTSVSLSCEELTSLVEVVKNSDAVLSTIFKAGTGLVEIEMDPPMTRVARFALVTLNRRTQLPALSIIRKLMREHMQA